MPPASQLTQKSKLYLIFRKRPPTIAARWMTWVGCTFWNRARVCAASLREVRMSGGLVRPREIRNWELGQWVEKLDWSKARRAAKETSSQVQDCSQHWVWAPGTIGGCLLSITSNHSQVSHLAGRAQTQGGLLLGSGSLERGPGGGAGSEYGSNSRQICIFGGDKHPFLAR